MEGNQEFRAVAGRFTAETGETNGKIAGSGLRVGEQMKTDAGFELSEGITQRLPAATGGVPIVSADRSRARFRCGQHDFVGGNRRQPAAWQGYQQRR